MDQLDAKEPEPNEGLSFGRVDGRAIRQFLLYFTLLFGCFCIPMAWIGAGYARAFCAAGNGILPDSGAEHFSFHLDTAPDPARPSENQPWTAVLTVADLGSHRRATVPLKTMSLTYLPIVAFLSLALATPIEDRRREILILVPGFLSILAISLLLTALSVIVILDDLSPIRILSLSQPMLSVLSVVFRAAMAPGMTYAVPGLLWWFLVVVTRPSSAAAKARARA